MSFSLHGLGLTHANGHVALADIDLQAQQGESIALIGPSGAGKTSLLNTIGTALQPTAGQLTVLQQPAWASAAALRALRARIGTVHQSAPIPPRQRVVTAVLAGKLGQWPAWKSLASLLYPQDLLGARQALERVHLADKLFVRCDQLSGGQLQRVGIARVLYQEAQLILADEPIASLDPRNARTVMDALRQVNREDGITVLTNLHHLDTARAYCDRIVAMQAGRVMFDGPPAELTSARVREIYGVAEHEFDESAATPAMHA
jgi:phosphonate transport system ATP-binding protein